MADYLAARRDFMDWLTNPVRQHCNESAYEHVTRDVIASLCVTGLLQVWGMAREQGERDGDDLLVTFCGADLVSGIAGIPCFGDAMADAHWLEELGNNKARFPNYFKEKKTPSDRFAQTPAQRQASYRQRQRDKRDAGRNGSVTKTVTPSDGALRDGVTKSDAREEKSKEEKRESSHPLSPSLAKPGVGVGTEKSKHDLNTCQAYAQYLHDTKQGVRAPGAYGKSIWRSGEDDSKIDEWLDLKREGLL